MRKKLILKVFVALMISTLFFASAGTTAEASCSSWTVSRNGTWQCRANRCGVLWINSGTRTRTNTEERWCARNNRQVRETRLRDETGSCCNA